MLRLESLSGQMSKITNDCLIIVVYFATQAEHNTIQYKYRIKTSKNNERKKNRQYRTDEQTRRENYKRTITNN